MAGKAAKRDSGEGMITGYHISGSLLRVLRSPPSLPPSLPSLRRSFFLFFSSFAPSALRVSSPSSPVLFLVETLHRPVQSNLHLRRQLLLVLLPPLRLSSFNPLSPCLFIPRSPSSTTSSRSSSFTRFTFSSSSLHPPPSPYTPRSPFPHPLPLTNRLRRDVAQTERDNSVRVLPSPLLLFLSLSLCLLFFPPLPFSSLSITLAPFYLPSARDIALPYRGDGVVPAAP